MVSVCVPVYNYDIRLMARDLLAQLKDIPQAELIFIDDGSTNEYTSQYEEFYELSVKKILLKENIGRSRIRNRFLSIAQNDNLLFLDCDSQILSRDFISEYLKNLHENSVVIGGRVYTDQPPAKEYRLHWNYGRNRESREAVTRNKQPYRSFMTNNFLIRKDVLNDIRFNEDLLGYGHEDTLFGFELLKKQLAPAHIDNPVLHGQLASNAEFLQKTEQGIHNLVRIVGMVNSDKAFIDSVTLLRTYFRMKKFGIAGSLSVQKALMSRLKKSLESGNASLRQFDWYKLLLFHKHYSESRS